MAAVAGLLLLRVCVGTAVVAPRLLFVVLILTGPVTPTFAATSAVGVHHRDATSRPKPLADADLPSDTEIVPAYQEVAVIGGLVHRLAAMDTGATGSRCSSSSSAETWPTQQAILAADPELGVRSVPLPPDPPPTKLRSCTAGLLLATGDLLVILDAEDHPEPDQLRKAAVAFAVGDEPLACVQAQLLVHNADRNFITCQFGLADAMRYELTVPGLARLGLPIPLGGSSNHSRTEQLRRAGGWDAWNATEDAALGLRLQAMGYHVGVVDSLTSSESVETLDAWVKQRTSWLKGLMLTDLVHSRRSRHTLRTFRPRGLVTLGAVFGGTPAHDLAQSIAFLLWATGFRGLTDAEVPGTVGARVEPLRRRWLIGEDVARFPLLERDAWRGVGLASSGR